MRKRAARKRPQQMRGRMPRTCRDCFVIGRFHLGPSRGFDASCSQSPAATAGGAGLHRRTAATSLERNAPVDVHLADVIEEVVRPRPAPIFAAAIPALSGASPSILL